MHLNFLTEWLDRQQTGLMTDLLNFAPELILSVAISLMLLLRLFDGLKRVHMGAIALAATVTALAASFYQWGASEPVPDTFTGMLVYDYLSVFMKMFLYGFGALVIWLSLLTGIPDREDSADFYTLLLGALIGMSIMASANHLLMIFIGVEMASLPSYALAGFLKGKRKSSEAALKYVVYGGGASGVMLYGISLLAGRFGTGYLPDVAYGFSRILVSGPYNPDPHFDVILLLGVLFIMVGIGFKLAAVPFHFWCPDVFEGAAAEIAGFLSVASKGAALALLGRFTLVLAGNGPASDAWLNMAKNLAGPLAFFAALTATFGNIAAYTQTNLKRLLAYSTIAQAGYMMMGLVTFSAEGAAAVLFYLVAYLFMNLGAFAVVAFLRNQTGSEDLSSFRGLIQRSPLLVIAMGFFVFSLIGVPPLAGFAAKFQIFQVLYQAGTFYSSQGAPGLSRIMYALLVIGGLNTVISLVYYLNILKVMILEKPIEDVEGKPAPIFHLPLGSSIFAGILSAAVLVLGIDWNDLAAYSDKGASGFLRMHMPIRRTENPTPAPGASPRPPRPAAAARPGVGAGKATPAPKAP
jgi:NADH-quinone oxidoreductase subunit N